MSNGRTSLAVAAVGVVLSAVSPVLACSPAPLLGCRTAERSSLEIRHDPANGSSDRLRWQRRDGQATLQPGFGSPTTATTQTLCPYDGGSLVTGLTVPPAGTCDGHPCWSARAGKGFTYKDKTGAHAGPVAAQSTAFDATRTLYDFLRQHPLR